MKQALWIAAALGALAAGPAQADGDWQGFYAGIGVGNLDADTTGGAVLSGDDVTYGLHGGYRWDFGQWVAGGELEYDDTDVSLGGGAATINDVWRAKVTIGYDAGPALIYGALGYAEVDTSLGDEGGEFFGLGLAYQVAPNAILGLELLEHDFDNINGSGVNAEATSVNLRASFRF